MDIPAGTVERLCRLLPTLNEKQRRNLLALEAKSLGHGGIEVIAEISGFSRKAISNGIKLLNEPDTEDTRIRKKGGGRKKKEEEYPELKEEIGKRIEAATRGDPESALLWTSKSVRKVAADLKKNNYNISHRVVGRILKAERYSLQANKKTHEGCKSPDRKDK